MKRWIALSIGLLLCAALAVLIGRDAQPSRTPSEPEPRESAASAAPDEPALIESPPQPRADASHAPDLEPPREAQRAPRERQVPPMTTHFLAMMSAFEAEPRDSRWASEQEARIRELVGEMGFLGESFDRNVTCRRTLCRFSLLVADESEDDMLSLMKLAGAVQTSGGLSLAYGDARLEGDKVRVTVLTPSEQTSLGDAGIR